MGRGQKTCLRDVRRGGGEGRYVMDQVSTMPFDRAIQEPPAGNTRTFTQLINIPFQMTCPGRL